MITKKSLSNTDVSFFHYVIIEDETMLNDWINSLQIEDFIIGIDGDHCYDKLATLREVSNKLYFPKYFGNNWDAFEECLNDLEWLGKNLYIILIKNVDSILKDQNTDFKILIEIIANAAIEWRLKSTPFNVIFHFRTNCDRLEIIKDIEESLKEKYI